MNAFNLKNVRVIVDGTQIFDITKISIKQKLQLSDRTAGYGLVEERTLNMAEAPDIEAQGFNGENLKYSAIRMGAPITDFQMLPDEPDSDNADFLGSDFFTMNPLTDANGNPRWCWGAPDTDLDRKDNSEWKVPILTNILNVGSLADRIAARGAL